MSYAPPSIRKCGVRNAEHGMRGRRAPATPHSALRTPHLSEGGFMARFHVCHDCAWNVDWVCQHAGCKICPGKQAKLGENPLKLLLTEPFFKCPLKKF